MLPEINTIYKCPICKKEDKEADNITVCIKSHPLPEYIEFVEYYPHSTMDEFMSVFPEYIHIKFSDGQIIKYVHESRLEDI